MEEPLLKKPIYSVLVARLKGSEDQPSTEPVIVAQYDTTDPKDKQKSGTGMKVTVAMLRRLPTQNTEMIMTLVDDLEFRFMNREGILVGAVCHRTDFRAEISRKFLKEIHQMVEERFYDRVRQAVSNSLNRELKPVLEELTETYSNVEEVDSFKEVNKKVAEVQEHATDAIEHPGKMLERGEKLDTLEEKTTTLQGDANKFKRNARKARALMMCRNVKMTTILAGVLLLLVGVIMGFVCHWKISSCSQYLPT